MTDKEALKIVNECIEEGKIVQEAFDYSFMYAVKEALEKQMPKKPKYFAYGYEGGGKLVYSLICSHCNDYLEVDGFDYKYCPNCGQAIDLSEVEE